MPFRNNKAVLQALLKTLQKIKQPSTEQALVQEGISCLLSSPNSYACINPKNPFVEEFFNNITSADTSHENCFSLFECLAIFFREKALRLSDAALSPEEKRILQHFENSGQWQNGDSLIASAWYYQHLPLQVLREAKQ